MKIGFKKVFKIMQLLWLNCKKNQQYEYKKKKSISRIFLQWNPSRLTTSQITPLSSFSFASCHQQISINRMFLLWSKNFYTKLVLLSFQTSNVGHKHIQQRLNPCYFFLLWRKLLSSYKRFMEWQWLWD